MNNISSALKIMVSLGLLEASYNNSFLGILNVPQEKSFLVEQVLILIALAVSIAAFMLR